NFIDQEFDLDVKTNLKVDNKTLENLKVLYNAIKTVKSNGIIIASQDNILGIAGGLVSRIDACNLAINKVKQNINYHNEELMLASDGFFPFDDIVDFALKHNIKYIIQPGGSLADEAIIKRCNDNKISMIFTNTRFFKH
ncbi:MAG: bifunctional phosphoribosylaminoimidazolecarboxamide formyltransferase/IMP cyclohydrolase, partial [Bacilli bacterium]